MKTASRIFLTFSLLVFLTGMAFSQVASTANPGKTSTKAATVAPGKFTDSNSNGVCDHREAKGAGAQGKNFVDKNGDGKCDNCSTSCQGKGNGNCGSKGQGCGSGCGKGGGKGNCSGQGQQQRNGCQKQGNGSCNPQPGK